MPSNGISYYESMCVKLAEPTELNISDSYYLTWKAAENADYYDLRIGVMDDSGRLYNETQTNTSGTTPDENGYYTFDVFSLIS